MSFSCITFIFWQTISRLNYQTETYSTMGGRHHQKCYTCEMNGHKRERFIVFKNGLTLCCYVTGQNKK